MRKIRFRKITNLGISVPLVTLLFLQTNVAKAQPDMSQEIRLGATLPLSGDISPYGNLIRDGIELAASDLRESGLQISINYQDVPIPGPLALTAINKLIFENDIQALAGNFWNPIIPIMAPAINRSNILAFHTAAADDLILDSGNNIFSTNSKIKDEAFRIANYVYKDMGARSACVMYIGTSFGENYNKHFISEFESLGGKTLYSELTKLGERDLRTVLTRVKYSSCDVFFAAYFGNNLGLVLKQAKDVGINKPIMAVYEAEDPSVLAVAGPAAEGLRFFVPEPLLETQTIKDYKLRFTQRFGYTPRILASNAYDATTILVNTISKCNGDSNCAINTIYSIRNYEGMSGTFSIDSDGAATKDFVLKVVRDGEFERY